MFNKFIFVVFALFLFSCSSCISFNPKCESEPDQPEMSKEAKDEKRKKIVEGYKFIADGSDNLNGRGLLIIAATIAMIVSTSYFRPPRKLFRGIYLLFIPGWLLIAVSAYFGFGVTRGYMGLPMGRFDVLDCARDLIQSNFGWQIFFFQLGCGVFAFWLIGFLLFWIFDDKLSSKK